MYNEFMARPYTLGKRAQAQAETRQRIVDAAVELHGEIGPASTSMSAVAERAGVQRNTLYAHFPDERSLLLACSAASLERDPLPDAKAWRGIKDRRARLAAGLAAIYAWYARNEQLAGCVLRDAESHPLVQEIVALRYGPLLGEYEKVLGEGMAAGRRALLRVALGYPTWRSLTRDSGLSAAAAVSTMSGALYPLAPGTMSA
jgi:AcrR family transcriptional regulator